MIQYLGKVTRIISIVLSFFVFLPLVTAAQQPPRFGDGPPLRNTMKVDVTEGSDLLATLSPDGTRAAFLILGQPWIVPREGGRASSIPTLSSDPTEYYGLAWAPDGRRLAAWFWEGDPNRRGIRIYDTVTEESIVLSETRDLLGLSWMPKGDALFFGTVARDSTFLWRRDISKNSVRRLAVIPFVTGHMSLSPDGNKVAFSISRGLPEAGGLWEMDLNTGERRHLVADSLSPTRPSYSPDGRWIAFLSEYGSCRRPWIIEREGGTGRPLIQQAEDVHDAPLSWSPEGDSLLYTEEGSMRIVSIDPGGGSRNIDFVATHKVANWTGLRRPEIPKPGERRNVLGIVTPALSPNGQQVAFAALGDLWVADMSGQHYRLTKTPDEELRPRWSLDGNRIAYFAVPPRQGPEVRIIQANGETPPQRIPLPHGGDIQHNIAWHPNGNRLAYSTTDVFTREFTVGMIDIASQRVTVLTQRRGLGGMLIGWNQKGNQIVYTSKEFAGDAGYRHQFIRIDTTSQKTENWPLPDSLALRSGWTQDLSRVAYSVGGRGYWTAIADESESRLIPDPAPRFFSWSKNGRHLLYLSGDRLRLQNVMDGQVKTVPLNLQYRVPDAASPVLLRRARIIDGTGAPRTPPKDVLIKGGHITAIAAPGSLERDGVRVVDAEGLTLLPGLINLHVHHGLRQPPSAAFPYFGTTTVRDMGTEVSWMRGQAEQVSAGTAIGPRVFYAGGQVEHETGHGWLDRPAVDRADTASVRDLIKGLAEMGAAVIKIRIPDPALDRLATKISHELRLPVTSHEVFPTTLAHGLDGKEHIELYYRETFTANYQQDVLALLQAGQTCITPTLMAGAQANVLLGAQEPDLRLPTNTLNKLAPFFSPPVLESMRHEVPPPLSRRLSEQLRIDLKNLKRLLSSEVTVAAGTDAGPLDPRLDLELALMVQSGMTPLQAIRAATLDAASCLGVEYELGVVAEGKRADLLLVRGDPSVDISDLSQIEWVMLDGRLFDRSELFPNE